MNLHREILLAERAKSDAAAFSELFDHFHARVFTYIRYRCDDDATADDLTAQVFERLLNILPRFRAEKGSFTPWLFTIARNMTNDHWRRARRRRQVPLDHTSELEAIGTDPEANLIAGQQEEVLLDALTRLPERERDILALKFAGDLTNREIARMTKLSESHVGVIIYRALKQLRSMLEPDNERN